MAKWPGKRSRPAPGVERGGRATGHCDPAGCGHRGLDPRGRASGWTGRRGSDRNWWRIRHLGGGVVPANSRPTRDGPTAVIPVPSRLLGGEPSLLLTEGVPTIRRGRRRDVAVDIELAEIRIPPGCRILRQLGNLAGSSVEGGSSTAEMGAARFEERPGPDDRAERTMEAEVAGLADSCRWSGVGRQGRRSVLTTGSPWSDGRAKAGLGSRASSRSDRLDLGMLEGPSPGRGLRPGG
jgi:hypothetical protein